MSGEKKPSVVKNYLYNLSYQILLLIVPLITMPYLARTLGLGNQGTFSVLYSVVSCFVLLGCVGLNLYGQREVAYSRQDPVQCNRIFWEIESIRILTHLGSLALYFGFIWFNGNVKGIINVYEPAYFMLFSLEIVASMFDISWYYQGIENFRLQTVRNFFVKLLGLALIFLFVRTESDLWVYIVIYTGMNLLGNGSLWFHKLKHGGFVRPDMARMPRHLRQSLFLFFPQVATTVYAQLDRVMLGVLLNDGNVQAGVYDNGEKVVKIVLTVITSIGLVMLSRVANSYMKGGKEETKQYVTVSFRLYLCLAVPLMFGLLGVAEVFVPRFFGGAAGFEQILPVMCVLCPIILFIGGSNVFGIQFLLPTNQMRPYVASVFVGMGVNVFLNFLLIPAHGAVGAAIATCVAEFAVLLVQGIAVRKDISPLLFLKCWRNYLCGGGMFFLVRWIGRRMGSSFPTLFVQVVLGATVYFVLLLLLRDPFLLSGLRIVLKKLEKRSEQ